MDWMRIHAPVDHGSHRDQLIEFPSANPSRTPLAEAIRAVNTIVATYPAPYTLMLSGGVDSQAMLWAWLSSGHEFDIVTARYGAMNTHDTNTLIEFCSRIPYKIDIKYVDFDVIHFLENEYKSYALKYDCSSPQICSHMKISEMVSSGTRIFSGNFILPPINCGPSLTYAIMGIARYAKINNVPIVPFFFLHTAELAYSFLPYCTGLICDSYTMKTQTYQRAGFPVIQQPDKYTGFEKVKDHYDQFVNRVDPRRRLAYANKPSKRIFDQLFRYPLEEVLNDPTLVYQYTFLANKDNL